MTVFGDGVNDKWVANPRPLMNAIWHAIWIYFTVVTFNHEVNLNGLRVCVYCIRTSTAKRMAIHIFLSFSHGL